MFDKFAGQEFDWFALDELGQPAIFSTAGWGNVPETVVSHFEAHQAIAGKFELPNYGSENIWKDYGRYGLYVYDYHLYEGPYCLKSKPLASIQDDFQRQVAGIIDIPRFNLRFEDTAFIVVKAQ